MFNECQYTRLNFTSDFRTHIFVQSLGILLMNIYGT